MLEFGSTRSYLERCIREVEMCSADGADKELAQQLGEFLRTAAIYEWPSDAFRNFREWLYSKKDIP